MFVAQLCYELTSVAVDSSARSLSLSSVIFISNWWDASDKASLFSSSSCSMMTFFAFRAQCSWSTTLHMTQWHINYRVQTSANASTSTKSHPDLDVCRTTPKMLWIHYLVSVSVSHFSECHENRPGTVWEKVINVFHSHWGTDGVISGFHCSTMAPLLPITLWSWKIKPLNSQVDDIIKKVSYC